MRRRQASCVTACPPRGTEGPLRGQGKDTVLVADGIDRRALSLNGDGMGEAERAEWQVERVAAQVARLAG